MDNLFLIIFAISMFALTYFVVRTAISIIGKDKGKRKIHLKRSGIALAVMFVSVVGFGITTPSIEGEVVKKEKPETVEVAAVDKPKEEVKAELAKKEAEEKVIAEAKRKEEKAAAELKVKQDAEAKVKADSDKKAKEEAQNKDDEPAKVVPTGSKKKVESAANSSIHKHFGKTSNFEKRKNIVDTSFDEETGLLTTIVLGNDNLSTKFIVGGMHKAITGVAQDMKAVAEVKELMIFVQFPLVDSYGNEKDGDVMRVNLTRSTLDKINFGNFDYNKVPDIADSYFLHTALQSK